MMRRIISTAILGALTVAAVIICINLGLWQWSRLGEKRALNARIMAHAELPIAEPGELQGNDPDEQEFRRVHLRGAPLYDKEMVIAARFQSGSPGAQLLTPVRPDDPAFGDTLILLLRGFVNTNDGRSYDPDAVREGDTLDLETFVVTFKEGHTGNSRLADTLMALRYANRDTIEAMLGAPVAPYMLQALDDTTGQSKGTLARVAPPTLSEGSHLSYTVQWFSFAVVFAAGFIAYVVSGRRKPVD